jgi:hypothetical protein
MGNKQRCFIDELKAGRVGIGRALFGDAGEQAEVEYLALKSDKGHGPDFADRMLPHLASSAEEKSAEEMVWSEDAKALVPREALA